MANLTSSSEACPQSDALNQEWTHALEVDYTGSIIFESDVTGRCHFEEPCDAHFASRAFLRDEDSFFFGCPIVRPFCEGWGSLPCRCGALARSDVRLRSCPHSSLVRSWL